MKRRMRKWEKGKVEAVVCSASVQKSKIDIVCIVALESVLEKEWRRASV